MNTRKKLLYSLKSIMIAAMVCPCYGGDTTVSVQVGTADIQLRTDGIVVAKGVLDTGYPALDTALQGNGVRMMWFPAKAAFRVGGVTNGQNGYPGYGAWDNNNIGKYSFATGLNPKAYGMYSFAAGSGTTAAGDGSIAMGTNANAQYGNDVAIGASASSAYSSVAVGPSTSSSFNSAALGTSSSAVYSSSALGSYNSAANYSAAVGYSNTANNYSTAFGSFTVASGKFATSLGYSTTAKSYASTVVGQFNQDTGTAGTWIPTDPLFTVGNGTNTVPSNAFVVYKNGDVRIPKRQGDILMGEFGN